MAKPRPEGIIARKDGDEYKKFPNGLKSTLKAIRKFWAPKKRTDFKPGLGRTPAAFATLFVATYNRVAGYYREGKKTTAAVASAVSKLEGSGKRNITDITFWKLRAYAEFVELPSSLLLLFSQMTSYEAQGHSRQEIHAFLRNCMRSLQALDAYLADEKIDGLLFHRRLSENDSELEYIALLRGLYIMHAAFGEWENRLRPDSSV